MFKSFFSPLCGNICVCIFCRPGKYAPSNKRLKTAVILPTWICNGVATWFCAGYECLFRNTQTVHAPPPTNTNGNGWFKMINRSACSGETKRMSGSPGLAIKSGCGILTLYPPACLPSECAPATGWSVVSTTGNRHAQ